MSNIIFEDEEYVKYKDKSSLININDKHFFNEYSWYYNSDGYLVTTIKFHQMVINFKSKLNPELSVDHRNRDKFDNRKCNLRITDKSTQAINRNKKSESVMSGVYTKNDSNGNPLHWVAELTEDGKVYKQSFSINKYGHEEAKQMAIKFRTDCINNSKYKDDLEYENKTNIIFEDLEEYVEYKGKKTLIDREDKHVLNEYSWNWDKKGYLQTTIRLHMMILNFKPKLDNKLSVDHVNGNRLDNTRNNLRIVDRTIQNINRPIKKNNTSGFVGVWLGENRRWVAEWKENKQKRTKSFSFIKYGGSDNAKKLAIEYRKEAISKIESYIIALGL
jgi:hypothetical protein